MYKSWFFIESEFSLKIFLGTDARKQPLLNQNKITFSNEFFAKLKIHILSLQNHDKRKFSQLIFSMNHFLPNKFDLKRTAISFPWFLRRRRRCRFAPIFIVTIFPFLARRTAGQMQTGHHQLIGGRHLLNLWRYEFSNSCHKIGSKKTRTKSIQFSLFAASSHHPKNYAHAHTKMLAFIRTQMPTVGADE